MAIESLVYSNSLKYYDSERRDRASTVVDYVYEDAHIFNYVPTFLFDLSNTSSSNKHRFTVMSLANGVRLDADIWYNSGASTDTNWYVQGDYHFIDSNGNEIPKAAFKDVFGSETWNNAFAVPLNKDLYPSLSDIRLNAYPEVIYQDGAHPNSVALMTWTKKIPNASPYDAPALQGTVENRLFTRYYETSGGLYITSTDGYNALWTVLEEKGDGTPISPQRPTDDTSGPSHTDPVYDPFSDDVDFPDLPTSGSSIDTGLIRAYQPTTTQLRSLATVLWSDDFVNTLKKVHNDPMEALISLHSIPFTQASGNVECQIGNFNTGVSMPVIYNQFAKRDLGSLEIPEHWGSALDYAPYVEISIFLPFIGIREIQVDDAIGKTLSIEYNVDMLSGATCANIKCGSSVLYSFNTSIIMSHPLSQSSYAPLYQSIVGAAGNVLSGYGSAGAPGAAGAVIGSAINVALSKQHTVSRGGSLGGSSGVLGGFTPYLIIHRPIQSLASGFAHFKGYPSNITGTIGSVSGYTEVENVHLNGITCTDNERDEIMALLYNGVLV